MNYTIHHSISLDIYGNNLHDLYCRCRLMEKWHLWLGPLLTQWWWLLWPEKNQKKLRNIGLLNHWLDIDIDFCYLQIMANIYGKNINLFIFYLNILSTFPDNISSKKKKRQRTKRYKFGKIIFYKKPSYDCQFFLFLKWIFDWPTWVEWKCCS